MGWCCGRAPAELSLKMAYIPCRPACCHCPVCNTASCPSQRFGTDDDIPNVKAGCSAHEVMCILTTDHHLLFVHVLQGQLSMQRPAASNIILKRWQLGKAQRRFVRAPRRMHRQEQQQRRQQQRQQHVLGAGDKRAEGQSYWCCGLVYSGGCGGRVSSHWDCGRFQQQPR